MFLSVIVSALSIILMLHETLHQKTGQKRVKHQIKKNKGHFQVYTTQAHALATITYFRFCCVVIDLGNGPIILMLATALPD